MQKKILWACVGLFFMQSNTFKAQAQEKVYPENPRLVVGVVIDQMRYDYLTRFWERYGNDGFKRLVREGFSLKNNHYNYVPTYTAPGHTSIYTGTTPTMHGIISNSWYDKFQDEEVYCVDDFSVQPVGTQSDDGKKSPHRLLTTTITDQNRLHTEMRGKTIGISLKDRSAILPAGHTANAAYWFHGEDEGKFITSSYYMKELPEWVVEFNASDEAEKYLKEWDTYYNLDSYEESGADLNNFEHGFDGKKDAVFPYDLKKLSKENDGFSILKSTPYGNSLVVDFSIAALKAEDLGQDEITDFLTVSFSSTDYVGHNFGVNSKEIEDTYIRLDREIARLLKALDRKVGQGNYTLFLTADHAGVQVPAYLKTQQVSAGYFDTDKLRDAVHAFATEKYGVEGLIANISNKQIFFNYALLNANNIEPQDLQNDLLYFLLQYPKISRVFTRNMLLHTDYTEGVGSSVQNGFHPKRSGDVVYVLKPAFISYSKKGSTHGSPYSYDTHVPLIFFGKGIKHGASSRYTEIPDIAPTIAALLGILEPNGTTGNVLYYVID